MDQVLVGLVPIAIFAFGWVCGHQSHQQLVKAEIRHHTQPLSRKLRDLPQEEILGILDFAVTGRKATGGKGGSRG